MSDEILTRGQALMLLHDHLGEEVYVGLWTSGNGTDGMSAGAQCEVISLRGVLAHTVDPGVVANSPSVPDTTRETFGYLYTVGDKLIVLAPLPGTIHESGHGLNFELTDGLRLRIAWKAPDEEGGA
jgi:hypothetical protein